MFQSKELKLITMLESDLQEGANYCTAADFRWQGTSQANTMCMISVLDIDRRGANDDMDDMHATPHRWNVTVAARFLITELHRSIILFVFASARAIPPLVTAAAPTDDDL